MVLEALPLVLIIGEDTRAAWSSRLFPGFSSSPSITWLHGPQGSFPGLLIHQGSRVLCPRISPPTPRMRPRVSWPSIRTTLGSSSPPEDTHCLQGCQQSSLAERSLRLFPGILSLARIPWLRGPRGSYWGLYLYQGSLVLCPRVSSPIPTMRLRVFGPPINP